LIVPFAENGGREAEAAHIAKALSIVGFEVTILSTISCKNPLTIKRISPSSLNCWLWAQGYLLNLF
jgi:hypothetical protein